jgi:aminoglycoside phosphotransferase (APT) family kinase protein
MSSESTRVREGEEINEQSLSDFIRSRLPDRNSTSHVSQFPAGSSNLTYLIKTDADEFVLRRPPFGNTVKTAHDMRREFEVLSKLAAVYQPAPKPIIFCDDDSVIGSVAQQLAGAGAQHPPVKMNVLCVSHLHAIIRN